jgi:hypothetical protein
VVVALKNALTDLSSAQESDVDTSTGLGSGLGAVLGGGGDTRMFLGLGGSGDPSAGGDMGVRDGLDGRERRRPGQSGRAQGCPDMNARRGNSAVGDVSGRGRRAHREQGTARRETLGELPLGGLCHRWRCQLHLGAG